jgi:Protein of unknown function (DUF3300)
MLKNFLLNGRQRSKIVAAVLTLTMAASPGLSQESGVATPAATTAPAKPAFKQEEIDQIVAPIALYPDSLLSQVFMAATYPLEIVQAARWVKDNKDLKGDALATELEKQTWDPSVKSLVNFPQVLDMMNDKLDWTIKLGDAFLGQQAQVMSTVQSLRAKAQAQGNLKSNNQQKVTVDQPAGQPEVIVIESAQPSVIYVPTYNPTVVYGTWGYPAYPPYYYYPPGYNPAAAAAISFGVGLTVGLAWGYAWGHCDWGHSNININVNRNVNINTHINRNVYANNYNRTNVNVQGGASNWQHDPAHRDGVAYRDSATAQHFNRGSTAQATQARDAYRGRIDSGTSNLSRSDGAGQLRSFDGSSGNIGPARSGGSSVGAARSPSGTRSGAFDGVGGSGSSARSQSERGQSSRAAARPSGGHVGGGGRRR